jgi:hypothetical protein
VLGQKKLKKRFHLDMVNWKKRRVTEMEVDQAASKMSDFSRLKSKMVWRNHD